MVATPEATVTERERLEREIYQLTRIINANQDALAFRKTRPEDRPALQQQIELRTARRDELQRQADALST
jgi:hypothetical protein